MSEGSSASARVEAAAEALRKSISNGGLTTLLPNPVLGGLLAALPDTPSGESRGETVAAYREALQEIATRPTVERNPDGDDQATETMQLLARETLAAHGELRPAMPNMPEAESRVRKPAHTEQQGEEEARGEADDEAFMEAWGSLKTYTLHAYSERYSPSIRHDGPNVRTYDADAVDALLVRLRPAFQEASDTPEVVERPETCPTCGSDDPRIRYEECDDGSWEPPGPFANVNPCLDPFHTPGDTEEAPSRALGFNPWCCIECGPVPADEIDAIGGEHDYRHVIGHPEHEEPEAFRIDLSEWHLRAPAQPDTEGEDYVEREFWLQTCAACSRALSLGQFTGHQCPYCNSTIFDHLEVATRAPTPQPDTKGEGQAVFVSALDEKDHELLRDLANASPEASIIDLLVTEHAELLARVNRAPAPPQPPVSSEEDREVVRDWLKVLHSPPGLPAAIQAVLTDATTLASQHRGDR